MNTIRRIRLITGMVVFTYVAVHLVNLSLGLLSLETMDAWRPILLAPWQSFIGLTVLYGSIVTHMLLGLEALYHRRTLRMTGFDAVQLSMALALPPLVILHVLGTRGVRVLADAEVTYAWMMLIYWKWTPIYGLRQVGVVVVAWIHGCMGIYYWTRLQPWWPRARGVLYPAAFVVPVAALLGFVEAGKDALAKASDPDWTYGVEYNTAALDPAAVASIYQTEKAFLVVYLTVVVCVLLARAIRLRGVRTRELVQVTYIDGPTVESGAGLSILEISRTNQVPHANVCGGRGRCGTCRVRILDGLDTLPARGPTEVRVLERIKADHDVRLACQTVPAAHPITVKRLLPADMGADDVHESELIRGKEIEIVILRAAIHGISDLAASAKPYDTVFILNRYLRAVRTEIEATGGRIDKYDARGFTALYGIDKPISEAARDALESAKAVHRRVEELNSRSFDESSKPLRVSIGLHTGRAVIGELSYGEERHLAALGEAVETTDRFERLGYANGGLTVSDTLAGVIGLDLSTYESTELSTAGNGDPRQRAYFIGDPADLVLGEA